MENQTIVDIAVALEKRICADPIISDDIKDLSRFMRVMAEEMQSMAVAVVALERRPSKQINVNYGK